MALLKIMAYDAKWFCYKANNPMEKTILIKQEDQQDMEETKS